MWVWGNLGLRVSGFEDAHLTARPPNIIGLAARTISQADALSELLLKPQHDNQHRQRQFSLFSVHTCLAVTGRRQPFLQCLGTTHSTSAVWLTCRERLMMLSACQTWPSSFNRCTKQSVGSAPHACPRASRPCACTTHGVDTHMRYVRQDKHNVLDAHRHRHTKGNVLRFQACANQASTHLQKLEPSKWTDLSRQDRKERQGLLLQDRVETWVGG